AALTIRSKGLGLADRNQVVEWFRDPRYREERILFIDARDDQHYLAGHIPGAFQLNYYHPDQHLPSVLQAGQAAEVLVVYCNGGDCEDSELTAQLLAGAFPPEKIHVYLGGFAEWVTNSLPVEIGARNSGVLRPAQQPPGT
ncbi:MAG TPA: rhodanese-like domain-containing protein, partial [Clostridia bacterium]|nr:rhodanese-like domain-containing protein [Clostridia bacterium]